MSVTFTAQDIATRVKRQFGDESGVQVTDEDVVRWINDAQREIAVQHHNIRQRTLFLDTVVAQQRYVVGTAGLLDAPESLNSVYYLDGLSYYALRYLSLQQMDNYINGWQGAAFGPGIYGNGIPQVYTQDISPTNANAFYLDIFPAPDLAIVNGIKVNYSSYPTLIATINNTIDLPAYYSQYVLEYCLMKAYEMDENWEAADRKAQYVQSTLNLRGNERDYGQDSYPTIMISPGDLD